MHVHSPIEGLLNVLDEKELIEFSACLEKFAKNTTTTDTVTMGSFGRMSKKAPKQLVGMILTEIEYELLRREHNKK